MNYPADQAIAEIEATIQDLLALRHVAMSLDHMDTWAALLTHAVLLKHVNWR